MILYGFTYSARELSLAIVETNEHWKIFIDYDSNEGETVTAESFLNAHEKWNYIPFLW